MNSQLERTICIIHPNRAAYSETFIQAHVNRLPATVLELYGGSLPRYQRGAKPLLPAMQNIVDKGLGRIMRTYQGYFTNRTLGRFLEQNGVDVVLAEYGTTGVALRQVCPAANVPLVVHFHGFDAYQRSIIEGPGRHYPELFEIASALIAVSRDMVRRLLDLGAPREKIYYNPCGVDMTLFSGSDPASAPPLFLAVGRFVDKKAPQVTLLAFSRVSESVPEARLIMIGNGPLWKSCKRLAHELGIVKAVEFHGPRPHAEIARTMQRARAFVQHSVIPSDGDSEGSPVVVLEAGASGLPVISTRHAGIPDIVIEGETGLLVDEGDDLGMAQAMIQVAEDDALAARLGKAARDRIGSKFTMDKSINNLWLILEAGINP